MNRPLIDGGISRFHALDSWRGIAAICVCIEHFTIIAHSHFNDLQISTGFALFVDFFFVLSGFVISFAYWETLRDWAALKVFALRRFARLWPLHIATLAPLVIINLAWIAVGHPAFTPPDTPITLGLNIIMAHGLGFVPVPNWNGQSWSISVEFWTYFVFAGASLLIPRRFTIPAALVVIAVSSAILISRTLAPAVSSQPFFRCVYGFFVGSLTYHIWVRRPFQASASTCTAMEIALITVILSGMAVIDAGSLAFLLCQPAFAALIYVTAAEKGKLSKMLLRPFPRMLGRLSYSVYLIHTLVLAAMGSPLRHHAPWLGADRWAGDVMLPIYLALTVGVSWCTFRWIEKPGTRMFGCRTAPHLPT